MKFQTAMARNRRWLALAALFYAAASIAQGPAPETAPPLFPGGALISYNSVFTTRARVPGPIAATARPTSSHEGDLNFTWGFHQDWDLAVVVPIVTNHYNSPTAPATGATALGDVMLLAKYRFYRRDSPRGTTQASFTFGPKLPTGRTTATDSTSSRLPTGLQPGSGSTDLFLSANATYTGLFHIRRLVADEDLHALVRTEGSQATRLGSNVESRFWLSYRPYESKNGAREWFIGPVLTWQYFQDDRIAGLTQHGSGGDQFQAGITTYVGLRPGVHAWLGADWDLAHSTTTAFMPIQHHISFGITQQFRLHI